MANLQPIKPLLTFDRLFPKRTAYFPLSCLEMSNRVLKEAFRLDEKTGTTITVMGTMPLICSENVASPLILAFFKAAGLEIPPNLFTYKKQEQASEIAREFCERGFRLAYVYPPSIELQADKGLLVPVHLYNWLNDKANLGQLVDPFFLSPYRILDPESSSIPGELFANSELLVKACFPGASGGGKDVLFCPETVSRDNFREWISSRREGISGIRVEKGLDISTSWCVNLAIGERESRYIGAAIQLFSEPSKQNGCRIDPDNEPPDPAVALALSIAERARSLGYRGVAGFDIGVTPEGRVFVFDLNFRLVASTRQVLLHGAATGRINTRISESWNVFIAGPLERALDRIYSFAEAGVFVPASFYEGTPLSDGKSLISGMIVADTIEGLEEISFGIRTALEDLLEGQ